MAIVKRMGLGRPLLSALDEQGLIASPYRELTRPLLDYLDELDARYQNDTVTVVIPEFVLKHWWGHLLHNQRALVLKGRLLVRRETVVTSVPYHLR